MSWINIKDRLPEKDTTVLCIGYEYGNSEKGFWKRPVVALYAYGEFYAADELNGDGDSWDDESLCVTHWMPLPDPPEDESK